MLNDKILQVMNGTLDPIVGSAHIPTRDYNIDSDIRQRPRTILLFRLILLLWRKQSLVSTLQ